MAKHRGVIIGAGRIGAGYEWSDLAYTHAGAYQALNDRVELVGMIEPNEYRAQSAKLKWQVPVYEDLESVSVLLPDIVSVCVQPEQQPHIMAQLQRMDGIKGFWVEKPWTSNRITNTPVQVNYLRRGDTIHRAIADRDWGGRLIVYGKGDVHTVCHFKDLAKWWDAKLDYRTFAGPCSYVYQTMTTHFFDQGGVNPVQCIRSMLENLLDHVDHGHALWSPPYSEEKEVHIEL